MRILEEIMKDSDMCQIEHRKGETITPLSVFDNSQNQIRSSSQF